MTNRTNEAIPMYDGDGFLRSGSGSARHPGIERILALLEDVAVVTGRLKRANDGPRPAKPAVKAKGGQLVHG